MLSVALRQRQIPSRERKFLCFKPGSSLSQTYCMKENKKDKSVSKSKREKKRKRRGVSRSSSTHHWMSSLWSTEEGTIYGDEHVRHV